MGLQLEDDFGREADSTTCQYRAESFMGVARPYFTLDMGQGAT